MSKPNTGLLRSLLSVLVAVALVAAVVLFTRPPTAPEASTSKYTIVTDHLRNVISERGRASIDSMTRVSSFLVFRESSEAVSAARKAGLEDPRIYEQGPDLSDAQVERLRDLLLNEAEVVLESDAPVPGCSFNPNVEFRILEESERAAITIMFCFTCGEIRLLVDDRTGASFGHRELFELAQSIYPDRKFRYD